MRERKERCREKMDREMETDRATDIQIVTERERVH